MWYLATGAQLVTNPLALLEEARDGTLWCSEIGNYSKAEHERRRVPVAQARTAQHMLFAPAAPNSSAISRAEGKFDAGLLRATVGRRGNASAVAHTARRYAALIERLWREATTGEPRRRCSRRLQLRGGGRARRGALARQPRPSPQRRRPISRSLRGEMTAEHVRRLLGETASPPQAMAPRNHRAVFEMPLREAREAFERIYFEQLLSARSKAT